MAILEETVARQSEGIVDDQGQLRSQGIGGSEVPAVLGIDSDEREIWSVYNRKIGLPEPEVDAETRMRWAIGKDLEQSIVRSYTRITGHRAEWFDKTIQHEQRPWQVGSPDALSPTVAAPEFGVDAKNVASDQRYLWGHPGERDGHFPERYEWQARYYMSLLDVDKWDIIALLGGSDLRIFTVERDMRMEREMLAEVEDFWINHVVPRVPPEINYSRAARDYVHAIHPRNRGIVRAASALEREMLAQYHHAREVLKEAERERDRLETVLKTAVGDDDGIRSEDYKFTWRLIADSEHTDWKAIALQLWNKFAPLDVPFTWAELQHMFTSVKPNSRRIRFEK